jgi:hypothetical protein
MFARATKLEGGDPAKLDESMQHEADVQGFEVLMLETE